MGAAPLDFSEIQEVGHLKTFQDCPITREATVLTSGPGNNHPSFIDLFFIDFFFIDFFFIDIFFIKISLINIFFIFCFLPALCQNVPQKSHIILRDTVYSETFLTIP
ncbi:hypothetical protein MmTuc01_2872 [Methanosarcina mazei Tuc01]|uniref:Uncharacterized protein n=1 Tax=Methanosarcina mazei Tuc01 TaxID=1236903 RepID=M1QM85_METMZ|nr:hypothetical protein MmTuc01_2872 [Methanosarcina mazei Tuc01]